MMNRFTAPQARASLPHAWTSTLPSTMLTRQTGATRITAAAQAKDGGSTQLHRERSSLAAEETVGLLLQMDCDVQLQRCLNNEAYSKARDVRAKRTKLDGQIQGMLDRKAARQRGPGPEPGSGSGQRSALDLASEGLRLRTEMQRAVEEERYKDASQFKEQLAALDQESKRVAAAAAEWGSSAAPRLRLGQRVTHTLQGFRAVVVGWDLRCCESDQWVQAAEVQDLVGGPFYHVLVDLRDSASLNVSELPPVAYVPEAHLTAPELEPEGLAWAQVHGAEPLEHPFASMLFLGQDGRGDYLPCRQLRNKFNAVRRDVYKPGEEPPEAS